MIQPWQKALRQGILPQLTEGELLSLAEALERDVYYIIQGACFDLNNIPARSCAVGYSLLRRKSQQPSQTLQVSFIRFMASAGQRMNQQLYHDSWDNPAWEFIRWFDSVSREEAFAGTAREIRHELETRRLSTTLLTSSPAFPSLASSDCVTLSA